MADSTNGLTGNPRNINLADTYADKITHLPLFHDPAYPSCENLDLDRIETVKEINQRISAGTLEMEVPGQCLCGAATFDLVATYDRYRLWQPTVICRECGLVQGRPRMGSTALQWFYGSDQYRRLYNGGDTFTDILNAPPEEYRKRAQRRAYIRTEIESLVGPIKRVAEIGCGAGWNLFGFHEAGAHVIGCDYSPGMTALGRRVGMDLREGPMETLYGEETDLLILSHVLEHLQNPVEEMKMAISNLNPKYVYLEIPDVDSFCLGLLQSAHLYYFSRQTLEFFMSLSGLELIKFYDQGCHFGALFKRAEAAKDKWPLVTHEYQRVKALIKRFEQREMVKNVIAKLGLLGIAQSLRRFSRSDLPRRIRRGALFLRMAIEHKIVIPFLLNRKRRDAKTLKNHKLMVNIGGAYFFARGWKTLEYIQPNYPYKRDLIDFEHNLTNGEPLPFADNSVDFFYSSHTFEHLPQENLPFILADIRRCLKKGGAVRITLPDFKIIWDLYQAGKYKEMGVAASPSPQQTLVHWVATLLVNKFPDQDIAEAARTMSPEAFAEHYSSQVSRAEQAKNGANHINWFTKEKLRAELERAGFTDIVISAPQQSRFTEMRGTGSPLGLGPLFHGPQLLGFDTTIPQFSLFIEATKP